MEVYKKILEDEKKLNYYSDRLYTNYNDKSKPLQREEFGHLLAIIAKNLKLYYNSSEDEVTKMFELFDKDHDGVIDKSEFKLFTKVFLNDLVILKTKKNKK